MSVLPSEPPAKQFKMDWEECVKRRSAVSQHKAWDATSMDAQHVNEVHVTGPTVPPPGYGNALLYGITDRLLHRLEMIQHSAARIIMCIKRYDRQSITAVLRHLHWLPVKWRINYKIVVLVFRALHGLTPAYVSTLIMSYEPRRALRSAGSTRLGTRHQWTPNM